MFDIEQRLLGPIRTGVIQSRPSQTCNSLFDSMQHIYLGLPPITNTYNLAKNCTNPKNKVLLFQCYCAVSYGTNTVWFSQTAWFIHKPQMCMLSISLKIVWKTNTRVFMSLRCCTCLTWSFKATDISTQKHVHVHNSQIKLFVFVAFNFPASAYFCCANNNKKDNLEERSRDSNLFGRETH